MKRKVTKVVPILVYAIMLSSCGKVSDNMRFVFLLDKSASTVQRKIPPSGAVEDTRGEYLSALREIVSSIGPGTEISGALINGNSLSVTNLPIKAEIPPFDQVWDNQMVYRDEIIVRKRALVRQLETAINDGESAQSTCIIDSLLLAQQLFEGSHNQKKVLVLTGDMIEDCQGVDFDSNSRRGARGLPSNEDEVKRLIDDLVKQHRLPDLRGVMVCVYGAKGGQQGDDSGVRFTLMKAFWKEFFQRAGAELRDYGAFDKFQITSESALDLTLPEDSPATVSRPSVAAQHE